VTRFGWHRWQAEHRQQEGVDRVLDFLREQLLVPAAGML
jgi:hypothetical protein